MLSAKPIIRKAMTFRHLAPADRKLAFAAIVLLLAVRLGLWVLPCRRLMRWSSASGSRRPSEEYTPRRLAWAVRLATRYVPAATCLPQAMTMHYLLTRYGHPSCLHVGVNSAPKFEAHAWVECDGKVVIGGWEEVNRFASILSILNSN
jgi:Transglutaminase-like superfamily